MVLPGASQGSAVKALLAFAKLGDAREVVIDMPPGMGPLSLHRAADFAPIMVTTLSAASYRVNETPGGLLLELRKKPLLAWRLCSTASRAEVQGI